MPGRAGNQGQPTVVNAMTTRNIDPKVREEAELWLARRLEPAVREAERQSFELWCDQTPDHIEAYAQAERLWDELTVLKSSTRLQALASQAVSVSRAAERPVPQRAGIRRLFGPRPLLLAASFAALV